MCSGLRMECEECCKEQRIVLRLAVVLADEREHDWQPFEGTTLLESSTQTGQCCTVFAVHEIFKVINQAVPVLDGCGHVLIDRKSVV